MRLIKIYDLGKIEYLVNPEQISYIRVLPGLRGKKMYDIAFSDDVTIRTNYENVQKILSAVGDFNIEYD